MGFARPAALALRAAGFVILAVTTVVAAPPVPSVAPSPISGVATDVFGAVLPGVEVLVLASDGGALPLASVRTDESGRFRVAPLAAGVYRLAALKEGYLTYLGSVNTYLRRSVDIVLRPSPAPGEPGADVLPEDLSWALRAPARSLLRDTDAAALYAAAARGGSEVMRSAFYESVRGQVEHLVALADWNRLASPSVVSGGETRMSLSSALGERGSIRVDGSRETAGSVHALDAGEASASRRAQALDLDVDLDFGRDASLEVKAHFSRSHTQTGTLDAMTQPLLEEERTWGYDARWTKQLDAATRLAVQLNYAASRLDVPGLGDALAGGSNRAVEASGMYESIANDRHRVRFGIRAQRVAMGLPAFSTARREVVPWIAGAPGWSLHVAADDSWALSGPMTLTYGLGLEQTIDGDPVSLVLPRVGAIWTNDRLRISGEMTYHAVLDEGSSGIDPVRPVFRPAEDYGYRAEVEVPLPFDLLARVGTRYSPVLLDGVFQNDDALSIRVPGYLTDGNAALSERNLVVEHPSPVVRTSVGLSAGEVRGMVAVLPRLDVPIPTDDDRLVTFRSGRIGFVVPGSGTEIAAEYHEIRERDVMWVDDPSTLLQRWLEVRVAQDLLRLQGGVSCRLLVAARTSPGRTEDRTGDACAPCDDRASVLAALNHRVSAGVAVAF